MTWEKLSSSCINHPESRAAYKNVESGNLYCMECYGLLSKHDPRLSKDSIDDRKEKYRTRLGRDVILKTEER